MLIISIVIFFIAALFEIGGGYLVWLWLRRKDFWYKGLIGALGLFIYGMVLTMQPANFGRVYAAYGGVFIVSSVIWGLIVDKKKPDRFEIIGALIALLGAAIIMYAPR